MTDPVQDNNNASYSLKAVLNKQPVTISTVIVAAINVAVSFGLDVTTKQLSAINTFVILFLALFINAKTANKAAMQEIQVP